MPQIVNPDPDLMRIFDFTAADLEANRAGRLSERQTKYIKRESDVSGVLVGCMIQMGIIGIGILAFAALANPIHREMILLVFPIGAGILILYLNNRDNQHSSERTLEAQHVGKVEGSLSLYKEVVFNSRSPIGQMSVDGKKFQIDDIYQEFQTFLRLKGRHIMFRVYFAPEINRILSMEITPQ